MKVMLIEPPAPGSTGIIRQLGSMGSAKADIVWPPYDLQILAGYLKKEGHGFQFCDAAAEGLSFQKVTRRIQNYRPDVVAFTITFPSLENDMKTADCAKAVSSEIKTIAINIAIGFIPKQDQVIKNHPSLDILPHAECEEPLIEWLRNGLNPAKVPGIRYRDGSGNIAFNQAIQKTMEMDNWGVPIHEGLPLSKYRDPLMKKAPMTIVNASRGCINQCIHCPSVFQKPLRYRSVENVLRELKDVVRLGVKEIKFFDCGLTNNPDWVAEMCAEMLRHSLNLSWNCNSRADKLTPKLLNLMKKAGCHTISVGCESADPQILKTMAKNETVEKISAGIQMIKEAGIGVLVYFTLGLPGETVETIKNTIAFAKRMAPDFVTFGLVVPTPGTEFYDYLVKHNYLDRERTFSSYDPNAIPPFNYPSLPATTLKSMAMKGYRSFYLRPGYVVQRIIRLRNPQDLMRNARNFLKVFQRYVLERPEMS